MGPLERIRVCLGDMGINLELSLEAKKDLVRVAWGVCAGLTSRVLGLVLG